MRACGFLLLGWYFFAQTSATINPLTLVRKGNAFVAALKELAKKVVEIRRSKGDSTRADEAQKVVDTWLCVMGINTCVGGIAKDLAVNYLGRSSYHNKNGPFIGSIRRLKDVLAEINDKPSCTDNSQDCSKDKCSTTREKCRKTCGFCNKVCKDFPKWVDKSKDGCSWASVYKRCGKSGTSKGSDGKTAKEACCRCGGGNVSDKKDRSAERFLAATKNIQKKTNALFSDGAIRTAINDFVGQIKTPADVDVVMEAGLKKVLGILMSDVIELKGEDIKEKPEL